MLALAPHLMAGSLCCLQRVGFCPGLIWSAGQIPGRQKPVLTCAYFSEVRELISVPTYSVVLPVFNECENLLKLYEMLFDTLTSLNEPYEILFVDDGSTDESVAIIKALRIKNDAVKLITFSRNFGHQAALSAGLLMASGKAVIAMDSDLQDSPATIPEFIEHWKKGYSVVYAIRDKRKEGLFKTCAYKVFYRIFAALSEIEVPLDAGDFSLMDRRVVDLINQLPERTRYVRGLRSWIGFKQIGIKVERAARFAGEPKYSLNQLFKLAFTGIISFSVVPLRLATALGLIVSFFSFVGIVVCIAIKLFTTYSLPGFAATASILLFLGGVQLLTVGILGEYVGYIFDEVKGRPSFIVSESYGINNHQIS
jgi:polyisoprenyl-phosphate glycosyltransferase